MHNARLLYATVVVVTTATTMSALKQCGSNKRIDATATAVIPITTGAATDVVLDGVLISNIKLTI